jgi:hypothetical protein
VPDRRTPSEDLKREFHDLRPRVRHGAANREFGSFLERERFNARAGSIPFMDRVGARASVTDDDSAALRSHLQNLAEKGE